MSISREQLQNIVQQLNPQARLVKTWELTGGISAQTIALQIALPDQTIQSIVLRQHGIKDRERNPNITHDEYRLLQLLNTAGLPVPKPYQLDLSNQILSSPYLLMEYINGKTHSTSDIWQHRLHQLVQHLVRIHQVNLPINDLSFLPDQHTILEAYLQAESSNRKAIFDALKHFYPRLKTNDPTLLHGDYWLGNILWRNDDLVGIIDWEDAMLGDPLSDLGKSRLELTWVAGHQIAETFTQLYAEQMLQLNMAHLHFWDLWGALRLADFANWFDDSAKIDAMQILYDEFVDRAIAKLADIPE